MGHLRLVEVGDAGLAGTAVLVEQFEYSLRAANYSPNTVRSYMDTVNYLLAFTGGELPDRAGCRAFLHDQLEKTSPGTAVVRHRGLKAFFKWCVAEGVLSESPMTGVKEPHVPEAPVPVLTDDEPRRLLEACAGTSFNRVRNTALLRVLIGSGCRLDEVAGLRVGDVCMGSHTATVLGKGRRVRTVGLTPKTISALGRYGCVRSVHRFADSEYLWLGGRGPLSGASIYKVVKRIGESAGVSVHPHQFRHTFAHGWLASGGSENELLKLAGWKNPVMLQRYAASTAAARALASHARMAPGDQV